MKCWTLAATTVLIIFAFIYVGVHSQGNAKPNAPTIAPIEERVTQAFGEALDMLPSSWPPMTYTDDLVLRGPAEELRRQANAIEARDKKIAELRLVYEEWVRYQEEKKRLKR